MILTYICIHYNNSLNCVYVITHNTWCLDLQAAWHVAACWKTHTAWPSFTWHQFMKSFPNIKHSFPSLCCNKGKRRHVWARFHWHPPKDSPIASFWPTFNLQQVTNIPREKRHHKGEIWIFFWVLKYFLILQFNESHCRLTCSFDFLSFDLFLYFVFIKKKSLKF